MAIDHPDRVLSLTSIMSNTGRRTSGYQHPMLLPHVLRRKVSTLEQYVEATLVFSKVIGSPGYPTEEAVARARAEETWARGLSYSGVNRQTLAIITQRDRTQALGRLRIPVTVVHGRKDRMVHSSGGRATARAVPGAELIEVPGMGHDLPAGLFDLLVDAITRTAERSAA
jgi:pimeloyl-ACP methyl ester carboxylesterase